MQGVTLVVAVILSTLAVTQRPAYALVAYIASLVWYPGYLVLSIGTVDLPASRLVVTVLLLRCILDDDIRSKFTWSRLDTFVAASMVIYVVIPVISYVSPATRIPEAPHVSSVIENRGGFLMDTWFAYIVARFVITDRRVLTTVTKCVGVLLVPLAVLGVIESVTFWQPFAPLRVYCPWYRGQGLVNEARFGFARAVGPFGHAILFGCNFALFLPLIYHLRYQRGHWRTYAYVLSGIAFVGALSCMSSGGWVMAFTVIAFLALEKHKQWVKPLLGFVVFSCIFVGIASNRPFYHVIASWANPLGGTGWHRAKLIDLAIEHFDQWWLVGCGGRDPGWGRELGMGFTDITNEFVLAGVQYGILGVVALCAVLMTAFRRLIRTYNRTKDPCLRSLCWAFGSLLASIAVTWMSVSFFDQLVPLIYCILGMIGSLCSAGSSWRIPDRS